MTKKSKREIVVESYFVEFEWDETKQESNLEKHGIDFDDAIGLFEQPYLVAKSNVPEEERFMAIGIVNNVEIAVIYTIRDENCRLISARRARRYERDAYHKAISRLKDQGQD